MGKVITAVEEKESVLTSDTVPDEKISKKETLSPLGMYEQGMPWNPVEKVILERRSITGVQKRASAGQHD